jgi:hypothetical protein
VDSEVRSGTGEAELEGRIESLRPTMPALTFKAAGKTVKTSSSTQFFQGGVTRPFSDLQIGMRVHVKGSLSGDTLTASLVEIQNTNTSIPVEITRYVSDTQFYRERVRDQHQRFNNVRRWCMLVAEERQQGRRAGHETERPVDWRDSSQERVEIASLYARSRGAHFSV